VNAVSSDAGRGALLPYHYVLYSLTGLMPIRIRILLYYCENYLLPLTDNWFCQFWHCGYALQLQQKGINGIYISLPTSDTNSPPDYWWYLVESTKPICEISLYSGKCIWQCRITEVHISRNTDWTGEFPYFWYWPCSGEKNNTGIHTLLCGTVSGCLTGGL
jgi:hypothetical protein